MHYHLMHTHSRKRFPFLFLLLLLAPRFSFLRTAAPRHTGEGPLGRGGNLPRLLTKSTSRPLPWVPTRSCHPKMGSRSVRMKSGKRKNGGTTKIAAAPLFFVVFFSRLSPALLRQQSSHRVDVCVRSSLPTRLETTDDRLPREKISF